MGVHLWGHACDVDGLQKVAQRHDLALLFDAAHAFGNSYQGQMIGNFGDAEVFSFHATKFCNTFEGGAIVTNNDALAEKARLMRSFGFADYDTVLDVGTNGKMSEVAAAMGVTSLESMNMFMAVNYRNYAHYQRMLKDLPGVRLVEYDEAEQHNYQYVVLEIEEAVTKVSRDHLQAILWNENVRARRYFYPGCHRHEPYRTLLPDCAELLPETERLVSEVLCLPTGTAIGPDEIDGICEIIHLAVAHGEDVTERLRTSAPDDVTANRA
jgi:dTDP-4-amino-4,6-dideoxygalactose transaminase